MFIVVFDLFLMPCSSSCMVNRSVCFLDSLAMPEGHSSTLEGEFDDPGSLGSILTFLVCL